jgi:hypothetical protein
MPYQCCRILCARRAKERSPSILEFDLFAFKNHISSPLYKIKRGKPIRLASLLFKIKRLQGVPWNFEYSEVSPIGRIHYEIARIHRNIQHSESCHDHCPFKK